MELIVLGCVVSFLLGLVNTLVMFAWRSVNKKLQKLEDAHYNFVRTNFALLAKLNQDKAPLIAEAMSDLLLKKTAAPNGGMQYGE